MSHPTFFAFARRVGLTKLAVTALIALCLFVLTPVAPTQAGVVSNQKFPFSGLAFHDCPPGETIEFAGTAHMVIREEVDGHGGFHQGFHFNLINVHGTGLTTGDKYIFHNTFNLVSNVPLEFREFTITQNVSGVRQGSQDNLFLHVVTKLTINSNNEVTAEFVKFTLECRG